MDDGPIVSGETERTTAHLVTALDDRYVDLERLHGEKGARSRLKVTRLPSAKLNESFVKNR